MVAVDPLVGYTFKVMNIIPVNLNARGSTSSMSETELRETRSSGRSGRPAARGHGKGLIGAEGVVFDTALPKEDGIQASKRSCAARRRHATKIPPRLVRATLKNLRFRSCHHCPTLTMAFPSMQLTTSTRLHRRAA